MFRFILTLYFLLISIMSILRVIFYYSLNINNMDIPRDIIFKSYRIGFIFDNSISSYFILGTLVLYLFYAIFQNTPLKILFKGIIYLYMSIFSFLIFLIISLDIPYFKEFNFHLNSSILDYLHNTSEIVNTAIEGNNIISYILLAIFFTIIFLVISITVFQIITKQQKKKIFKYSIKSIFIGFIKYILLLAIFVIGARGGISQGTLNWGRGIFSDYNYANQLSINPVFYLGKSLDIYRKEASRGKGKFKATLSEEEISSNLQSYVEDDTTKFISKKNPLLREIKTGIPENKMNVVIVLMESFMGANVGALGGTPDLTPNYNKLTKKGLFFTNFYSNGNRSNRGIVSVLTGFPSSYGKSVIKKNTGMIPFVSLAEILKERGYSTSFIYGGDIEFDNMQGFLKNNNVDTIISKKDFPLNERTITWGVNDHFLYKKAEKYMDSLKEPFFVEMFTLSNHAPYDIEPKYNFYTEKDGEFYKRWNSFRYADEMLGEFINSVKDKKWAQNTIFIFVADHGQNLNSNLEIDFKKFTNPLLIYTPGKQLSPQIIDRVGSQVDIIPTLMGILGGNYTTSAWGKDLLHSKNNHNYAYIVDGDLYGLIDENNIYIEGPEVNGIIRRKSDGSKINEAELLKKYKNITHSYLELNILQENKGTFGK